MIFLGREGRRANSRFRWLIRQILPCLDGKLHQFDGAEGTFLRDGDLFEADQFEHGQERHDDLRAARTRDEQLLEDDPFALGEAVAQRLRLAGAEELLA